MHPKPWHPKSLLTGVSRGAAAAPLAHVWPRLCPVPSPGQPSPRLGAMLALALQAAFIPSRRQEPPVPLLFSKMPPVSLLLAPPGAKRGLAGIFPLAGED